MVIERITTNVQKRGEFLQPWVKSIFPLNGSAFEIFSTSNHHWIMCFQPVSCHKPTFIFSFRMTKYRQRLKKIGIKSLRSASEEQKQQYQMLLQLGERWSTLLISPVKPPLVFAYFGKGVREVPEWQFDLVQICLSARLPLRTQTTSFLRVSLSFNDEISTYYFSVKQKKFRLKKSDPKTKTRLAFQRRLAIWIHLLLQPVFQAPSHFIRISWLPLSKLRFNRSSFMISFLFSIYLRPLLFWHICWLFFHRFIGWLISLFCFLITFPFCFSCILLHRDSLEKMSQSEILSAALNVAQKTLQTCKSFCFRFS